MYYGENIIKNVRPAHGGLEYVIVTNEGKYTITAADFRRIGEKVLSEGNVIDDEITRELEFATEKLECIQKSLKFLEYGDLTEKKLRMKLATNRKVKFSKEAIDASLEILKKNGYIDDERLAQELCDEYFKNSHLSPRVIKAKLFQKGFDSSTISSLFEEYDFDDDTICENMTHLCVRKFGFPEDNYRGEYPKEIKMKALEYLVRNGYSYERAKSFLNSFSG